MASQNHFETTRRDALRLLLLSGTLTGAMIFAVAAFNPATTLGQLIRPREGMWRRDCQLQLQQTYLNLAQYTEDNAGSLPAAGPSVPPGQGWAAGAGVPLSQYTLLHCFIDPHDPGSCCANTPAKLHYTDYWFNLDLSRKHVSQCPQPESLFILGEGDDGTDLTNSNYSLSAFPPAWLTDPSKPPFRHFMGANYAFADGHVKWMKPDQLTGPGAPRFVP